MSLFIAKLLILIVFQFCQNQKGAMATLAMTNIDTLLDHAINDEGAKVNFCVLKEFLTSLVGVLDVGGVEVNAPTLLAFGDSSRCVLEA